MNPGTIALIFAVSSVIAVGALTVYIVRSGTAVPAYPMDPTVGGDTTVVTEKVVQLDRKLVALQASLDRREGVIEEQMTTIGGQVTGITSLFNNDRQRGNWGELALERIFEAAGLVEGRDYENQFNGGEGRPDAVVFLPGDQTIVIDSKFPVARYLEAMQEENPEARRAALVAHGKELEAVGKQLAQRRYADGATAGYVIVFVPSQAVYEAAAEAHPDVVEHLMQQNVIVAGPASVFGLIKTAGSLMAQHRAVKDARAIVEDVRELRNRLGTFASYLDKLGKALNTASKEFNKAIGSWNSRLSPSVNRIAEMAGTDGLADLDQATETIGATAPKALKEAV